MDQRIGAPHRNRVVHTSQLQRLIWPLDVYFFSQSLNTQSSVRDHPRSYSRKLEEEYISFGFGHKRKLKCYTYWVIASKSPSIPTSMELIVGQNNTILEWCWWPFYRNRNSQTKGPYISKKCNVSVDTRCTPRSEVSSLPLDWLFPKGKCYRCYISLSVQSFMKAGIPKRRWRFSCILSSKSFIVLTSQVLNTLQIFLMLCFITIAGQLFYMCIFSCSKTICWNYYCFLSEMSQQLAKNQ